MNKNLIDSEQTDSSEEDLEDQQTREEAKKPNNVKKADPSATEKAQRKKYDLFADLNRNDSTENDTADSDDGSDVSLKIQRKKKHSTVRKATAKSKIDSSRKRKGD